MARVFEPIQYHAFQSQFSLICMGFLMWKYVLAWLPMVMIAIANGLLRQKLFARHLDELRAHQLSTLTGVLFFGIYIWSIVRIWTPESRGQAIAIGLIWLSMTLAFEFLFGHLIMGHPWSVLFHDYNVAAGRIWIVILIWVTLAPYAFYRLQE